MSDDYIERKEFHNRLDEIRDNIANERKGLREDIQEMKETLNNGVTTRAKENRKELKGMKAKLNRIESKIDKAQGSMGMLRLVGATLGGSLAAVGSILGILKILGAFAHWT